MKNLLLTFLFLASATLLSAENYKEVKVKLNDKSELKLIYELGMDIDHVFIDKDMSVSFFVDENDFAKLKSSSLNFEVLIDDWYEYYANRQKMTEAEKSNQLSKSASKFGVTDFGFGSMGGYYTYDETVAQLDYLHSAYGSLFSEKEVIGTTYEGRNIYAVKISDNAELDEDEPELLYTAMHHAREPEGMMQMIYFMYYLLENYGSNEEVTYLVDNREIYFIPVVNVDGYVYNETTNPEGGGFWRKNRRINGDSSIGVDLNRNYGPEEYWDAPNGGSSGNGNSDTYRGIAPFSEPETAAIRDFLFERNIKTCLNYHSYGNLLIFPYGALEVETPDSLIYREFARDMTQYNNYTYGTDQQTVGYSTRGNSDDYMYDGDIETKGKIFAMTPEVGEKFWPAESQIIPLAEENIYPNLYYAWAAGGYATAASIEFSKKDISAGDTAYISIDLKNKGLSELGRASVFLHGSSNQIQILNGSAETGSLQPGERIALDNVIQFVVNDNIESGSEIFAELEIYTEDGLSSVEDISFTAGVQNILLSDSSNSLQNNWITLGNVTSGWSITSSDFHSAPSSFTDSPAGNYKPSSTSEMELKEFIDLSETTDPKLSFWTKWEINPGWDYAQVLVKSDTADIWTSVGGRYSRLASGAHQPPGERIYDGSQFNWVEEIIDLSDFQDEKIKIKFLLRVNGSLMMDGWYVDDILVYWYGDSPSGIETGDPYGNKFTYKLGQNYPNPFNPATVISFELANPGFTSIKIYDVLGREVAAPLKEFRNSGHHEIVFNSSEPGLKLSSGVYFYRLESGDFVDVKKMLLIR